MGDEPLPDDRSQTFFRDVTIAYSLLLGGMILAGIVAEPFRSLTALAYPAALCLGLLPFWWFTRYRGVHELDFYDYLAFLLLSLVAMLLGHAFAGGSDNQFILFIAVTCIGFTGWSWIRRGRKPKTEEDSGTG